MNNSVNTLSAEMVELHRKGQIIDDLLGGTDTMRQAGKRHLYKMELESQTQYENRLGRSTLYPALSETLSQMTGRVFFKPIDITAVNDSILPFFDNIDLEGNNLDVFATRWFYSALAYGCSYVLVDFTRTDGARTLAEEKQQGARPYFVHIKPNQVLGFRSEMQNGNRVLTQFRYKEWVQVDDGEFNQKSVEQITVYDIGRVRKYRLADKDFVLVDEAMVTTNGKILDHIPIVAFTTREKGFMLGEPPLLELAFLNIKHWQSQSDQDNILNTARVPLLARVGVTSSEDMRIGNSIIDLPENGSLSYVEHSGNAIKAGQDSLKELENQMRVAGAKLLDKTVLAMTDSQARDESTKEISQLRLYANKFEDALDLALEYLGHWLGLTAESVGNVEISGNIDNDLDPNSSMDMIIKLQAVGTLSKQTAFEEAKRRGLVSDNVDWEEEQHRLDSEGMGYDFEKAPEPNAE